MKTYRIVRVHNSATDSQRQVRTDAMHRRTGDVDPAKRATAGSRKAPMALCVALAFAGTPLPALCEIVTRYSYDAGDHVAAVTDPRGLVTTYAYDGLGQKWRQVSPDTGTTSYAYTSGYIRSFTRANGITTDYRYDGLGRVEQIIPGDLLQRQTFSYDACPQGAGRLCSIGDPTGAISYSYTPEGWVSERTFSVGPGFFSPDPSVSYTLNYNYDSVGHISAVVYPDQSRVMYRYAQGVVDSVTLKQGSILSTLASNITYRPGNLGMTSWTSSNGLLNTLSYDSDSRLTGVNVPGVQNLNFGYDTSDRITQIGNGIDPAMTQNLAYDTLSRLTAVASTADNQSFAYDLNGNRTAQSLNGATANVTISGSSNQLLTLSGSTATTYGYDPQGNLTRVNGVTTFTYDGNNRLTKAGNATYYVSPEGQRLKKNANATITYFAPSGSGALLAEGLMVYGSNSSAGEPYTVGMDPRPSVRSLTWNNYHWLNGRLIGRNVNGAIEAIHADQTGRPEAVTNSAKAVVWRARNFVFDRTVTVQNSAPLNLGFPGQYFDAESGLWNNGFRDYSASLGRYIQSDPIGLAGGLNTYAYVAANPLTFIDPLGLDWVYHQSTGQYEHVDGAGNASNVGSGYSGHGAGVNNSAMQGVANIGPIPVGDYTIQPQQDNVTGSGTQLPGSMRLTPNPNNDMQGRGGFLIHGPHANDQMDSSNGCPIANRPLRNQIGLGVSGGDNQLHVVP